MLSNTSNTYQGGTNINAGTLSVSADTNLGDSAGGVSFTGAGTFQVTESFSSSRAFTLGGAANLNIAASKTFTATGSISGTAGLTKTGSGILAVTSDNSSTFSGPTTISAGTFLANNPSGSATGTGDITVEAGALLGGTGGVAGNVTVNDGGVFSPGASIGTLKTGALSLLNNSTFVLELQSTGSLTGDFAAVTGNLTLTGDVTLSITDSAPGSLLSQPGDHLSFASYTATQTGVFRVPGFGYPITDFDVSQTNPVHFYLNGVPVGIDYNYDTLPSDGIPEIALVVVPEPGSFASLAGAAGVLLGLRRFRRKS